MDKISNISSIIVAAVAIFALTSWRRDKRSECAISMLSLLYSVKSAFERITTAKWGYNSVFNELETKYSESHDLFISLRIEYNYFKAVYGSLCEREFSVLWREESKIIKTFLNEKVCSESDSKSNRKILTPTDYLDDAGIELMENVTTSIKNIERNLRGYIDRPFTYDFFLFFISLWKKIIKTTASKTIIIP